VEDVLAVALLLAGGDELARTMMSTARTSAD